MSRPVPIWSRELVEGLPIVLDVLASPARSDVGRTCSFLPAGGFELRGVFGALGGGGRVFCGKPRLTPVWLGVIEIGTDRIRQVDRGVAVGQAGLDQLCGHCGHDKIAASSTSEVGPCAFSRWQPVGNVLEYALAEILDGQPMADAGAALRGHFGARRAPSVPDMCAPQCGPSCRLACVPQNN